MIAGQQVLKQQGNNWAALPIYNFGVLDGKYTTDPNIILRC